MPWGGGGEPRRAVSGLALCSGLRFRGGTPLAAVWRPSGCRPCFMSRPVALRGAPAEAATPRTVSSAGAGSCANICTEHAGSIWRQGGAQRGAERKPIKGFPDICSVLPLNAPPPLTRRRGDSIVWGASDAGDGLSVKSVRRRRQETLAGQARPGQVGCPGQAWAEDSLGSSCLTQTHGAWGAGRCPVHCAENSFLMAMPGPERSFSREAGPGPGHSLPYK